MFDIFGGNLDILESISETAMAFSLLSMGPVIFGSVDNLIAFLQRKQLLATNKTCPSCGAAMSLQRRQDIEDKFR